MNEKILLISEVEGEEEALKNILGKDQYAITRIPFNGKVENALSDNNLPLILADFDLVRDRIDLFYNLQQSRSKACLILYGNNINSEELSQILQKGIYAYIPRTLLANRLKDTILGGLENRRAFIEILGMMDDLKELNTSLKIEKDALKKRNLELSFINRLSSEIAYDSNWDSILQRMIKAGLNKTLEYGLFGILFKMGSCWKLTLHMGKPENTSGLDLIVSNILERVNSGSDLSISEKEVELNYISMKNANHSSLHDINIIPLDLAGKTLGFILYKAGESGKESDENSALINTLTNMLPLSLKNAQEYYKLKEAAVTDSLTGVYNRKGLFDFLKKELSRAKRYKKPISFVITDMDDFKSVNDSMGHQAGDYALQEFAGILKESFREPDIVSRLGGDEFSILLPETNLSDAHSIMTRVIENLEQHTFEWGADKFKLKMSYGISNIEELTEENNSEELIRLADSRLYIDKAN